MYKHNPTFEAISTVFRKYVKQVLIIIIVIFAISVYGCSLSFQIPTSVKKNPVNLRYSQKVEFNYTAFVKPSLLYDNKTILKNDNRTTLYKTPLSRRLVTKIDIGLQYDFNQTPILTNLTDVFIEYETSTILNYRELNKIVTLNEQAITSPSFNDFFIINITSLEEIVETISMETGTNISYNFKYVIKPKITLHALFKGERITRIFSPNLTINFEDEIILMEGFENEVMEPLRSIEEIMVTWNQIPISFLRRGYLIGLFTLSLFILSTVRVLLQQESYTEWQVEVSELPETNERLSIKVKSITDLVKISKKYQRPILHYHKTFMVLNGELRYMFVQQNEIHHTKR